MAFDSKILKRVPWLNGAMLLGVIALALALDSRVADQPDRDSAPAKSQRPDGEVHNPITGIARGAVTVWRLPWPAWKQILFRTYEAVGENRLLAVAAGVVFYGLLALFPTITAFVSFYGLFAKASTINGHLSLLAAVMPAGGIDIVSDQVGRILAKGDAKLGFAFAFGLALALWSANAGIKAIVDGLNVIHDKGEHRGFFKLNLVTLAFTLGAIASLLLAIAAIVVLPLLLARFGLESVYASVTDWLRWPALMVLILIGLAILYRFGPAHLTRWRWITPGTLFAMVAWLSGSALLSWYLRNFANYDATYGSLGAAIGLMMWMWLTAIVILVGAELNAVIEAYVRAHPAVDASSR